MIVVPEGRGTVDLWMYGKFAFSYTAACRSRKKPVSVLENFERLSFHRLVQEQVSQYDDFNTCVLLIHFDYLARGFQMRN